MPVTLRMRSLVMLPLLALALLMGGTLVATPDADAASRRVERVLDAKNIALRQLGDRYAWGSAGPNSFDCSGLIYFSARKAGIRNIPRTSSAQARHARRIPRSRLRPGDLMFFTGRGGVYHVGMFVGRRQGRPVMVHSPGSGKRVTRARPWTNSWFAGTLRG